jgi:signal transduction histidine kinase
LAKKTRVRSLTLKLLGMLLVSALAAGALYLLCGFVGQRIVTNIWLSPARTQSRMKEHIRSFRDYVDENDISSTDAAAVGRWSQDHADVRLTVHGRNTVISADSYGAEITLTDSGLSLRLEDRDNYPCTVNFSDGSYTVNMYDHSDTRLYNIVNIASIVLSAAVFLVLVLLYERHVTYSILRLSRQVRQVSRGSLQLRLHSPANDEIGQLAEDVEAMRLSILDKLRREEEALQANTDLITAISHDVRTPLTALMGYLDILSDPALPPEVQRTYLDICRNNAQRLKDLTDELFGFFLVFGKQTPEQMPESFDAAMLLEQILVEAQAELTGQGFAIRAEWPKELAGMLKIDLNHLRRVFDNLFSNLRKYADPQKEVVIRVSTGDSVLHIAITNAILTAGSRVESNKIGLKTCDKLLTAMGGRFRQNSDADRFTAEVTLPLYPAE